MKVGKRWRHCAKGVKFLLKCELRADCGEPGMYGCVLRVSATRTLTCGYGNPSACHRLLTRALLRIPDRRLPHRRT